MLSFEEKTSPSLIFGKSSKNPAHSLMAAELNAAHSLPSLDSQTSLAGKGHHFHKYMISVAVDVSCQS